MYVIHVNARFDIDGLLVDFAQLWAYLGNYTSLLIVFYSSIISKQCFLCRTIKKTIIPSQSTPVLASMTTQPGIAYPASLEYAIYWFTSITFHHIWWSSSNGYLRVRQIKNVDVSNQRASLTFLGEHGIQILSLKTFPIAVKWLSYLVKLLFSWSRSTGPTFQELSNVSNSLV